MKSAAQEGTRPGDGERRAMHRRTFLGGVASVGAAYALGSGFWRTAFAEVATEADGPYGPLLAPDANGIRLPAGFTSAVVAESATTVPGTALVWHPAPDGAATFATEDGGWVYVCNSEVPVAGGVNALRFDASGAIVDGYPILRGTSVNCAGGPTPWGTWLSCEEYDLGAPLAGMVWECEPGGPGQGTPRPALGRFSHEAVCADPVDHRLYLSEDQGDGRFYRFTPATWSDDGAGVLDAGLLEAAVVGPGGSVTWIAVPDPSATATPTRKQVAATSFNGGEGLWFDSGVVYLATKGDARIWAYDTTSHTIDVLYDATPLGPDDRVRLKVDNLVGRPNGELFVAEDSGDRNRIAVLAGMGGHPTVSTFLEVIEASKGSEITGPTFDPGGSRLFFSSQRGASVRDGDPGTFRGITYVVTGPFE
jgi:secreted PhoX family phosphatase